MLALLVFVGALLLGVAPADAAPAPGLGPAVTATAAPATAAPAAAAVPSPSPAPAVTVPGVPNVSITVGGGDEGLSRTVVILLLLTVGAVAPSILLLMTTFTRFVVVLGITKNALGLQTVPPSQVLVGLALFLSLFSMRPVLTQINQDAVQPFLAGQIGQSEAFSAGFAPIRGFMLAQTRDDDLDLFVSLSGEAKPAAPEDVATTTLIPAFVVSELRTAFTIGFVIFIPFLIIDLVVASVLMSMGMMMLPPVFVSLPLKLLLFVLVNGWALLASSLVRSVVGVGP